MAFYFEKFDARQPPEPLTYSAGRELLFQYFAVVTIVIGGAYLWWRWTASLNMDALWFAIPLVLSETAAFIGLMLFIFNLWKDGPVIIPRAPRTISECESASREEDRQITVDVFFTTYNEDVEIVRFGLHDAKKLTYPHPLDLRIHVLDDGRRSAMKSVAEEEGVNYITRSNNTGFKAGNLRNALEQTSGDFIVICDADTRPFPTMLERCMGHFCDPKVAWVQTPQWFYDLPGGKTLTSALQARIGLPGRLLGGAVEGLFGKIMLGEDPFVNDPKMFYDVILRRRNWANASFCCGAGSIHRREAVMEVSLRSYAKSVESSAEKTLKATRKSLGERHLHSDLSGAIRAEAAIEQELTPYKFHVSEDIYTSIVLHSDRERGWKSILHPYVESKMLSPQDLVSWTTQRFKYAGGSLDILFNDNPLLRKGLTLPQKLMYASTFWSYLGCIWNVVFLLSPAVYLFTGIAPVSAYSIDFFLHFLPFVILLEITTMLGTWGISSQSAKNSYLSFFPVNMRAIWTVLSGKKISFPVTPKQRQGGVHLSLVWPQIAVVLINAAGVIVGVSALALGWSNHSYAGVVSNSFWAGFNVLAMWGIISAAFWQPEEDH